jgi:uncharacterized membrane protein
MVGIRKSRFIALTPLFALCIISSSFAQEHEFTTISFPGAFYTQALGINFQGAVVGLYSNPTGIHGFRLIRNKFTTIDGPSNTIEPRGINSEGTIVGDYTDVIGNIHGFRLRNDFENLEGEAKLSAFTTIDFPGAGVTEAFGINSKGTIVGYYSTGNIHGFRLSKGKFTSIDFPDADFTLVSGVNSEGTMVGSFVDHAGIIHGFRLRNDFENLEGEAKLSAFTTIDFPGAEITLVSGINSEGTMVGVYRDGTGTHGFRLTKNLHNLGNKPDQSAFTTIDFPGAEVTQLTGINSKGIIVGHYQDASNLPQGFRFERHHADRR